jgi:hypothetical protein
MMRIHFQRKSFFRDLRIVISRSFALSLRIGLGFIGFIGLLFYFGFRNFSFGFPQIFALFRALWSDAYGIVLLITAPVALFLTLFVEVPKLWVLSVFTTAFYIMLFPVDNLPGKSSLARYVLLLANGSVFCDRKIWPFSLPPLLVELFIIVYCYFYPIS